MSYAPIFSLFSDVFAFSCCHVRRAGNTIAHLMAKCNVNFNYEIVCTNYFSQSILSLVEMELV